MRAKHVFSILWLISVGLFVWAGFAPRYLQPLSYPYQDVLLMSLLTLGEAVLVYYGFLRLPRLLGLGCFLFLLLVSVLLAYTSLTTSHAGAISGVHGLWLLLLSGATGIALLSRRA